MVRECVFTTAWQKKEEVTRIGVQFVEKSKPKEEPMCDDKEGLCPKCKKRPAQEPHPCPFQEEIHNDSETCTCCAECEQDCRMDI